MLTVIDDLEKDHAKFRKYLSLYKSEINKIKDGAEADYALLEQLADYFSLFPDELHHKKEDIIYDLLAAVALDLKLPLEDLHAQHKELSNQAMQFAGIVKGVLCDQELSIQVIVEQAEAYSTGLEAHMAGEEDWLFGPAKKHFTDQNWAVAHEAIAELFAAEVNRSKAIQVRNLDKSLEDYLADS